MKTKYEKLDITDYDFIFKCIHQSYIKYCTEWFKVINHKLNLKKLQIYNIFNPDLNANSILDKEFENYMYSFRSGLDNLYLDIRFEIEMKKSTIKKKAKFIGRTKTIPSIMDKIDRKMKDKEGRYPINKYLNDLLGFRIIDPYYKDNIEDVYKLLEGYKDKGSKVIHKLRSNKGYEGYHIYFKESNFSFPIEIQIWDMENEPNNLEQHKVYKQGYLETIIKDYNSF